MHAAPLFDQRAALEAGMLEPYRIQAIIGGLDDEPRIGPCGNQGCGSQQLAPVARLPPRETAKERTSKGQRRLLGSAEHIRAFPFGKQRFVIELQTRRLLGRTNVHSSATEKRCGDQGQLSRRPNRLHIAATSSSVANSPRSASASAKSESHAGTADDHPKR